MDELIILLLIVGVLFCFLKLKLKKQGKGKSLSLNFLKKRKKTNQPTQQTQHPVADETQDDSYKPDFDYSYMPYKKAHLLTKTEYIFFVSLMKECNKRKIMVCPKVRLEDVAYVTDKNNRLKYRGYIKSRHIDFILVNMRCETIAGVELDDPSHETEKAAKTDRFKNELFKTIGVPLIRIKVGTDYAMQLNAVFNHLNLTGVVAQQTTTATATK